MNPKQKTNWALIDPIEVWNKVREGKELTQFPPGFLDQDAAKAIVRKLMIEELKMTREQIVQCKYRDFFKDYSLGSVSRQFTCTREMLQFCFPELKIEGWDLPKVDDMFWQDENNRSRFVQHVAAQEEIDLAILEQIRRINSAMIISYGGSKALKAAGSLYELLRPVIPEDIKEWNLVKMSQWTEEKAREALLWLAEVTEKDETTMSELTVKDFYDHDLGGLLSKHFHHSPLEAVQYIYPELQEMKNKQPKPFALKRLPKVTTEGK